MKNSNDRNGGYDIKMLSFYKVIFCCCLFYLLLMLLSLLFFYKLKIIKSKCKSTPDVMYVVN